MSGFATGFCFSIVFVFWTAKAMWNKMDAQHEAAVSEHAREAEHLRTLGFSYAKSGRKVSRDGIEIAKRLMVKKRHELNEDQLRIVDHYSEQLVGTGQAKVTERRLPPDNRPWVYNPKADSQCPWELDGGRVRSAGRTASSLAIEG